MLKKLLRAIEILLNLSSWCGARGEVGPDANNLRKFVDQKLPKPGVFQDP